MKLTERQYDILKILKEEGKGSVAGLSEKLFVSEMTIRRDLTRLEHLRLVKRYRGGAVLVNSPTKMPIEMRMHLNDEEKRELAKMAEKYICDEQLIFLDSSSTCFYLIPILKKYKKITVITNSVSGLLKLSEAGICCASTGGYYYDTDMCFVGEETIAFIQNYRFDIAFFSAMNFDQKKKCFYDDDIKQTLVRRAAIETSKKNIFLFDSAKLNAENGKHLVCKPELIDDILFI